MPPVEIVGGKGHRHGKGRTDLTLRVIVNPDTQPVAVAVVEVKVTDHSPSLGLDQAKRYDLSDVKVGKKTPFTQDKLDDFFRLMPSQGDSERSWTVPVAALKERNYDLKAVNPNAKSDEDTRTPEELLDLIEQKGREVAEALAALRGAARYGAGNERGNLS